MGGSVTPNNGAAYVKSILKRKACARCAGFLAQDQSSLEQIEDLACLEVNVNIHVRGSGRQSGHRAHLA